MVRWLFLLGGLIVWLVHFLGVYAIASIADVVQTADAPGSLWAVVLFSRICAGADLALLALALRLVRMCVVLV